MESRVVRMGLLSTIWVWQHTCICTLPTENCLIASCSLLSNSHIDDYLLIYSSISAFIIDETTALPPFLPMLVMNGTPSTFASSSFDSAAETNPTGIPTTRAGFVTPSLIMVRSEERRVGKEC